MPTITKREWEDPEEAVRHGGVVVHFVYRDGEADYIDELIEMGRYAIYRPQRIMGYGTAYQVDVLVRGENAVQYCNGNAMCVTGAADGKTPLKRTFGSMMMDI